MRRRYRNKAPFHTFRPNPEHWTRKGNSFKQKETYESEDEAWEYIALHPKLQASGVVAYQCSECCKWHVGHRI